MTKEKVSLIFANGKTFVWKTWKLSHAIKVTRLQKKYGDPVKIVGDGLVAETLREKYLEYNANPSQYKCSVFGLASQLSGVAKEDLELKFKKVKDRLVLRKRFSFRRRKK